MSSPAGTGKAGAGQCNIVGMKHTGTTTRMALFAVLSAAIAGTVFASPWTTDKLTVAGDGFRFSVSPPERWSVRLGNPPRNRYQAVLMIWPRSTGAAVPLVTVDAKTKTRGTPAQELDEVLKNYMKRHRDVEVKEIKITHGQYTVAAKSTGIAGKFHEYLVFIDPGKEYHHLVVAAMRSMGTPAADRDLKAFQEIVESITYLGDLSLPETRSVTGEGGKKQ